VRFDDDEMGMNFSYYNNFLEGIGKKDGENFTGPWIFYNTDGRLFSKGNFDNSGKRTGEWTWFHEDGSIEEISNYKSGKLEGENKSYFENGKLKYSVPFNNDEMNGEFVVYNDQGALLQK